MSLDAREIALASADGHRWNLLARIPDNPRAVLLWLPAMGVAARHYLPFAEALAALGIAVFVHEWRGHGSSSVRASRECDWSYRELLLQDIPVSEAAVHAAVPDAGRLIGGHSLGGQLAACRLALDPDAAQRLWLVASSAPFPGLYSGKIGFGLPVLLRLEPWLSALPGYWPGRRLGIGGRESRGVMHDWAGTGRARAFRITSLARDLDPLLARVSVPIDAIALAHDGFAPEAALRALIAKLGGQAHIETLGERDLGVHADHFAWLRQPQSIVARLAAHLPAPPSGNAQGATR